MAEFQLYIDDDRYEVASLYLISTRSEARARALAEQLLNASAHHRGIELHRDGASIYALGSLAAPGPQAPDATTTAP